MTTLHSYHRQYRRDYNDPSIINIYMLGWVLLSLGTAFVYMYSASIR